MSTCEPHGFPECYVEVWLWYIVPILLLITGTVGNILNIVILSRKRMRKYSTTIYLLFLAVADMTSLWTVLLPRFLKNALMMNIKTTSQVLCKGLSWFASTSGQFSIWLLVLMTIERMLLTISPVLARTKLNRRKAVIATMAMLMFWLCLSFNFVLGLEVMTISIPYARGNQTFIVSYTECMPVSKEFMTFYRTIWSKFLVTMTLIALIVIFAGNGVIMATLLIQRQRLRKVKPSTSTSSADNNTNVAVANNQNNKNSPTRTLFLVCGMFLVTTLPYNVNRMIVASSPANQDPRSQARSELATSLTSLLFFCNFTFNFVLYFVSGTMFKQEWKRLTAEVKMKLGRRSRSSETVRVCGTAQAVLTDTQETPSDLH